MALPVFHKTRIAPTPSGFLHVGNISSFLFTRQLAKQYGADVLLRIDDMDRLRANPVFIKDIFATLRFLEIGWEEGPTDENDFEKNWSQVYRLSLYEKALQRLADSGKIFACNCSRSEIQAGGQKAYTGACLHKNIPLQQPGVCWRLNTTDDLKLAVKSIDGDNPVHRLPASAAYFIVKRKDGLPAYQLTSLVDDTHFNIDLIVRGMDLWDSTLAQLYLAELLQLDAFKKACFVHHPLLLNPAGKKLSKSSGDTSIQYLVKSGLTRDQVLSLCRFS